MTTKHFTDVKIKDADEGTVEAVFSTFDVVDLDGDVTVKDAITDGAVVAISAYGHGSWKGALPVGKGRIRVEEKQAVLEGRFFLNTTGGRDTFETVKEMSDLDGPGQEWSYSLTNVESEKGTHDGRQVNILRKIHVDEVSPVFKGAGIGTRTLAVKGAKFSEHADSVLADVDALIERASEVVALRAEKGKTIAEESAELLLRLDESLERLKALVVAPSPDSSPDEVLREYARFVSFSTGVTS